MPITRLHTVENKRSPEQQFELDVIEGLSANPKHLSSKYFYDDVGSELFKEIMANEEYYLTNAETEVFETHKSKLAKLMPEKKFQLVELGAGDGRKTQILLREFLRQECQFQYMPVDISEKAMEGLEKVITSRYPQVNFEGLVGDYFDCLDWPKQQNPDLPRVVLFLGSNYGNFDPEEGKIFLKNIRSHLRAGDLFLLGLDLKKDIEILVEAYNDKRKITQAFNLNLLTRINRTLNADFDLDHFRHFGTYDPLEGAMVSFLIAQKAQTVTVKGIDPRRSAQQFTFKAFEPIKVESSYKFLSEDMGQMAREAGFQLVENFTDEKQRFLNTLWSV